ncbi:MAG: YncE family protein [Alphaproteobacteria bacterium]|uniref:YncE family protein n=1 Tax=Candidatus Nitrobium versatile TaxID=2884831 RepID=A0A953J254_9BACT|nr:YncE family protein [Candidatus Nitrobium versatile]
MLVFLSGCLAQPPLLKPALEEEGEIFVYLQPFPQGAERLRFRIERVSAVRDDGAEFILPLALSDIRGGQVKRQKFFAAGLLPPGTYTGLSCTIRSATLAGEEGETALLLPEEPARIDFPFSVEKKKALLLALSFDYFSSVKDGFTFLPVFSAAIPGRPIPSYIGYVSNSAANTITVFDKRAGQVTGMIATGRGPRGIAFDPQLRKAYVALSGEDAVAVIDMALHEVITRIPLTAGDTPQEVALTPDRKTLLVVNSGSNTLSMVSTSSLFEQQRISVGNHPRSVLVDAAGKRAFVFNALSNTVSVVDIPGKTVIGTLTTETGPFRGQFNRKGDRLYIIHEWSPYLIVVDSSTFQVLKRVFVGVGVSFIKVDTLTDMIYLCRTHDGTVEIYDPFSLFPGDLIRMESGVVFFTVDGEENTFYLALPDQKVVVGLNSINKKVVSVIDVGEDPYWIAVMGER